MASDRSMPTRCIGCVARVVTSASTIPGPVPTSRTDPCRDAGEVDQPLGDGREGVALSTTRSSSGRHGRGPRQALQSRTVGERKPGVPTPDGSDFYDQPDVFARYFEPRRPAESPVETMETPAFWAAAGSVTGLRILDLGCGGGELGVELLRRGAGAYVGVDASSAMLERAAGQLDPSRASVSRANLTTYRPRPGAFDLVVSLRVLHYLPDLADVLRRARQALVPGGRIVYTHEHPVITSFEARERGGKRANWVVDDYFRPGARQVTFLGRPVVKYHRTLEEHLAAVRDAGFRFSRLSECRPVRDRFLAHEAEYERRLRIPLFLLVEAENPN